MSFKGLKHSLIFIKIKIPLKKLVLLKYMRNKPNFSLLIIPFLYTRVLEKIPK